jgi:L-alanine-DL-glutamate epimerase-like enolase superfamily enzyme
MSSQPDTIGSGSISSVRAIPVSIPLNSPVRWATREVKAREFVLTFLEAGDETGIGYAYAGAGVARSMAMFISDVLAPRITGLPDTAPSRPWADLYRETVLVGRRGLAIRAMSAIDLALWDLLGKRAGMPLNRLLGGISDDVPAYASGGYYRPGDPLEHIEREITRYLDLGFRDVKIKVGGLPAEADAARVERARLLVGPQGRVALDANNAWKSPTDAIHFVRMVEHLSPWWIEEPLAPDDIAGHAEIARATDVPVATGEIHSTRWDFRALIEAKAADILQPDATVVGGVSEWMRIAHTAESFDIPVAPHWNHDVHVHLAAAVTNCLSVEWFDLEQDITNFERLLAEPMTPSNGRLVVPDRPGTGLVMDMEAVERYAIDL